ncbi:hypothetical protein D9758_016909 [Tetrapyrgos nigripes]|uniref:Xylanolytic transcriptional activator regulatory domain-containing protein n=1 Tax=Tetrapyrgos nigripes TaxID=182062 RepID=A0A8H5C5B5_9AGAR|nr:hypothetical protein D9758_016909 [Tetrapyrgos nigripes]
MSEAERRPPLIRFVQRREGFKTLVMTVEKEKVSPVFRDKTLPGDSANMPDNICSNCISLRCECTHALAEAKKKRGPPKGVPRIERPVKTLVKAILSSNPPYVVPEDRDTVHQHLIDLAIRIKVLEDEIEQLHQERVQHHNPSPSPLSESQPSPLERLGMLLPDSAAFIHSDSANVEEDLSDNLKRLVLEQASETESIVSTNSTPVLQPGTELLTDGDTVVNGVYGYGIKLPFTSLRRPDYWNIFFWQLPPEEEPLYLFFRQKISSLSLYSFFSLIAEGLHYRDHVFGSVVLAVCANASRYSNDPRVFCEGSKTELSAGWKWFRQIKLVRSDITFRPPTIYDLQLYCLAIPFLGSTSTYHATWTLTSLALRLVQEMGGHRRKPGKPTVESELLKRAFWCLYILDIIVSTFMNKPRAMSMDDLDVDLPIECDDEYWETGDPQRAFQQPPDQPSYIASCVVFIKLLDIMSFAQRALVSYCICRLEWILIDKTPTNLHFKYSVRRSHFWTAMGMSGPEWNEKVVKEIDTSLAKWFESVPSHLKWNPQQPNQTFFNQSSCLHATYYWVQIFVHKASIPRVLSMSSAKSPSLSICVNAARSCCRVMEEQNKREILPLQNILMALYSSAVVLILNAWREKRLKTPTDASLEMVDVYKCISIIQSCESRWQAAGTYADYLWEIIALAGMQNDLPKDATIVPQFHDTRHSLKRAHESETSPESHRVEASLNGDQAWQDLRQPVNSHLHTHTPQSFSSASYHHPKSSMMNLAQLDSAYLTHTQSLPGSGLFGSPGPLFDDSLFDLTLSNTELGSLPLFESLFDSGGSEGLGQFNSANVGDDMDVWMNSWMSLRADSDSNQGLDLSAPSDH